MYVYMSSWSALVVTSLVSTTITDDRSLLQVKIWFQNRRTKWKKLENVSSSQAAQHKQASDKPADHSRPKTTPPPFHPPPPLSTSPSSSSSSVASSPDDYASSFGGHLAATARSPAEPSFGALTPEAAACSGEEACAGVGGCGSAGEASDETTQATDMTDGREDDATPVATSGESTRKHDTDAAM